MGFGRQGSSSHKEGWRGTTLPYCPAGVSCQEKDPDNTKKFLSNSGAVQLHRPQGGPGQISSPKSTFPTGRKVLGALLPASAGRC